MRIDGLHIDGFGIFHDTLVDEMPSGLALFVGSNESGKSTLMEFVRYVLFGPPTDSRENRYPPLRGGRHGGRLATVLQDDRKLTIQRHDRQVALCGPDGDVEQVEPSARLFGGIPRGLFQRVFAVGLEDLKGTQVIQTLENL